MHYWQELITIEPEKLVKARLELHHAAQIPSAGVGRSLLTARADDSQTALAWVAPEDRWVTEPIPDTGGLRAGLRPRDLCLTVEADTLECRSFDLRGETRDAAVAWLEEELQSAGIESAELNATPPYEIPRRASGPGEPFDGSELEGLGALSRWFANGERLIGEVAAREAPRASPIRTWPHHFDLATLITLGAEGEEPRTIGVGLSPGDEHYPEPYFYVSPWPYPDASALPRLPSGGTWHTTGFVAAVLQAQTVLGAQRPEAAIREFLQEALEACRALSS